MKNFWIIILVILCSIGFIVVLYRKILCDTYKLVGKNKKYTQNIIPYSQPISPDILTTNNIFMVWVGKYPKPNYMKQIKNAIISAKHYNPNHNLYLFSNIIPASEVNCIVLPINLDKFLYKNSPVEEINMEPMYESFNKDTQILPSLWSDMFRCIILWKYGGSYIDIDDISVRSLPTNINNILPASAIEDKKELKEYNGGMLSNHFNYKWRFGIDPILNICKGNLFILEILKNMKTTKPEDWGQILPTKIFKSNIEKWSEYINPVSWPDLLYHPKHDGHSNFDKRYTGDKIKWDEEATEKKINTLLQNYKFPLVKNHNFCSDTSNSVLASLINKNLDIYPNINILADKKKLKEDFYSYPEDTKATNSNWVIPQLVAMRMVENEWINSEILKVCALTASDGSSTGIPEKYAHIFLRHEPNGPEPRKNIDLFLDGNYLKNNNWTNRYYVPWCVMSYELRSQSPSRLLIPLGKQNNIRKTKFCCFMFGNIPKNSETYPGAYERYQLYEEMNKLRKVEKPKSKKIPRNIFDDAVLIYEPYQFVISYENTNVSGYITEKIINSFLAGSIPIYYGTDHIFRYFNKDSFIYANNFVSRKELIQYVFKVADDPRLLSKYLNTPPCTVEKLNDLFRIWYSPLDKEKVRNNCPVYIYKLIDNIPKDLSAEERRFWVLQCKHNLPINLMFADYLKAQKRKYCFVSRDCYFLALLYKKMYPDDKSIYFMASRTAMKNNSKSYVNYTRYFVDNCYTWVDLAGTNISYCEFMKKNFGTLPAKNLLVYYDERTGHTPRSESCLQNLTYLFCGGDGLGYRIGNTIELFNRSLELRLEDVVDGAPKYSSEKNEESVDKHKDWCVNCYEYIINNISSNDLRSINYDKDLLLGHLKDLELEEPTIP